MKSLLFTLLVLTNCSVRLPSSHNACKTSGFPKLNLEIIDEIILGEWEYLYSYKEDTCFVIIDLGDLSKIYDFKKTDGSKIKGNYPNLYQFGNDKLLFGIISKHTIKPFGETSYPLINQISKDSSLVRVTHYLPENGTGKGYSYFIESISNDTLVIFNERRYKIGEKRMTGVRHIYLKSTN